MPGDLMDGPAVAVGPRQQRKELLLDFAQNDPVLRALWTRERRLDGVEVHFEHARIVALTAPWHPKQPLSMEVTTHHLDVLVGTAGRLKIAAGLLVDGKETDRRAVLGCHVR